jgi:hypothetical protein
MATLPYNRAAKASRIADVLVTAGVTREDIDDGKFAAWASYAGTIVDDLAGRTRRTLSPETLDVVKLLVRRQFEADDDAFLDAVRNAMAVRGGPRAVEL